MKTIGQTFLRFSLIILIIVSFILFQITAECQSVTFDLRRLPEKSTVKLSEIGVTDIQYIPLETTPNSVIPRISRIIFSKNYLLTQQFININMFRLNGSFVTKIGTEGRGPNEFTVAHDVDINPKNESIYIVDGWQQKFIVFDKTGKVIRTFKSPLAAAMNFKFTEDGILSYNQNSMGTVESSFILLDTTGKVIKSFPNKYPWKRTVPTMAFQGENIFYRYNGQLIKKEMYCDTLFIYKNKDFKPHMIINIGNLGITPKIRTESTAEFIMKNILMPMNLFEFGDFIYYEIGVPINGKTELLGFIGSKKNNFRTLIDPGKDLINDFDGGPNIWPKSIKDDNTIVSWIDAITLKKYVASDAFKNCNPKYPDKKKELEKLANSLQETDNPIIVLVKLKM